MRKDQNKKKDRNPRLSAGRVLSVGDSDEDGDGDGDQTMEEASSTSHSRFNFESNTRAFGSPSINLYRNTPAPKFAHPNILNEDYENNHDEFYSPREGVTQDNRRIS